MLGGPDIPEEAQIHLKRAFFAGMSVMGNLVPELDNLMSNLIQIETPAERAAASIAEIERLHLRIAELEAEVQMMKNTMEYKQRPMPVFDDETVALVNGDG